MSKMRTGKISENVLKRSVLKRIKSKNENVAQGPAIGQDCAIVRVRGQEQTALSTQVVIGTESGRIRCAVYSCANNLFCSRSKPTSIMLGVVLPEACGEEVLRTVIDEADLACKELHLALMGGHTTVSPKVNDVVITITGIGISREACIPTRAITENLELVMVGKTAMAGTALLARRCKEDLKERFPWQLVEDACVFDQNLSIEKAAGIGWDNHAAAMHDVSEGGIFGALWEMCESAGIGMEVDLRKIPIRQETIEICEVYHKNPYQLLSGGSVLIAVRDGGALKDRLMEAGIDASVIGWTTDKKDKILKNGEEIRYLDKPAQDQMEG